MKIARTHSDPHPLRKPILYVPLPYGDIFAEMNGLDLGSEWVLCATRELMVLEEWLRYEAALRAQDRFPY
jgi:hypothetical protein